MFSGGIASFLSTNMSFTQMRLCLQQTDQFWFILGIYRHFCHETRFQRKWRPVEHLTALMHLYYDIPELLKFKGNDLNDELRRDKTMKMDIKQNHKLPNLHMVLCTIP
jgi:hypothetical protein